MPGSFHWPLFEALRTHPAGLKQSALFSHAKAGCNKFGIWDFECADLTKMVNGLGAYPWAYEDADIPSFRYRLAYDILAHCDAPLPAARRGPAGPDTGIANSGVQCCMIALLQALLHIPEVAAAMAAHQAEVPSCPGSCFVDGSRCRCPLCVLRSVGERVLNPRCRRNTVATEFYRLMRDEFDLLDGSPRFPDSEQHDAHELLESFGQRLMDAPTSALAGQRLLLGRSFTTTACEGCGYRSTVARALAPLQIPMVGGHLLPSLASLFHGAVVLGDASCGSPAAPCASFFGRRSHLLDASTLPKVLTVQLARWDAHGFRTGRRDGTPFTTTPFLHMRPFCDPESLSDGAGTPVCALEQFWYEWVASVRHLAGRRLLKEGHFITDYRGDDGHVYTADDEKVYRQLGDVHDRDGGANGVVYIAFYHRLPAGCRRAPESDEATARVYASAAEAGAAHLRRVHASD